VVPPANVPKATRVRSVEGITEYRLPNGLTVLLFPDPTQSTITVNVTYLVGSRHEGYGETGMAHLLEHMMFKGSPKHRNVMKLVEERGGHINGSTWFDRTNYYETLPASQENLDWTLELEADRMLNASISPEDLATELSVVRNELEMGENDPEGILDERILSTAYLWHAYGKSTIGARSDVERVKAPALRAFYDRYYQPDNAVLIVSGKLDEAAALASIEKTFGVIAKPLRVLGATYTVEPAQDGERTVTLRRTGDVHVVALAYHAVSGASDDYPAVEAALDVLTREPSGRLYKRLVESQLAASLGGSTELMHDPYVAQVSASIRDARNVARVQDILIDEIEHLGTRAIDPKEVERWRIETLKDLELAFADSEALTVELSEFAALGDWRTVFAYRNRVEKVTSDDVARVAKTYFKTSNRTLGVFVPTKQPERAPLTEAPDVATAVKDIVDAPAKAQGEAFAATLENIEKRTTRTQLAGGIAAALLPKQTRGAKVTLRLRLHWGTETALKNREPAAALVGPMLSRGTTKHSFQDLQDLENQLKTSLWISTSADGLTLTMETIRDKLPAAVDLAFEILKSPAFPAKQLELVRQEQLAGLEEVLEDPQTIASDMLEQLTSKWPASDPRYSPTTKEQISLLRKVTLAQVKQFYKDFVGAGHGELAVVGDFDAAALTAQTEKHVAGWQTKPAYARLSDKAWAMPGATRSIDVKDKEMATIVLGQDFAMKDTDPDYPAMLVLAQLLGGGSGSRAWMRLREKEGLSYGVELWVTADPFDSVGDFGGYAIVAPQNVAKAKASLLDEIAQLRTTKVSTAELQRAKDSWIKDQDTSLSNDDYLVSVLGQQTYRKRTTAFMIELRAKIRAVTPDDVMRVAAKYLDPTRFVVVDAGDQAKAAAH
jgi:zinc protease